MSSDNFILKRSRRKSLAISIANAEVVVRAPLNLDMQTIHRFVNKKRHWIASKLQQQQQRLTEVPARQYQQDEAWPYLGEMYRLDLQPASRCCIKREADTLRVATPRCEPEYLSKKIEQWYKQEAQALFEHKVEQLSGTTGIDYHSVKVRKTKSRWGHCTRDGVLQFNWLLLQAPERVVDYVVVHELCHRVHFNHSAAYWSLVASLYTGVAEAKHWLKENGHTLVV